jgi:hypothetical protein
MRIEMSSEKKPTPKVALARQAGDTVGIATTNLVHLNRFPGIDTQVWDQNRMAVPEALTRFP